MYSLHSDSPNDSLSIPTNYRDNAFAPKCHRRKQFGLALINTRHERRQKLLEDINNWLDGGHCIDVLPGGVCRGLSRYDPDNMSLYGALYGQV